MAHPLKIFLLLLSLCGGVCLAQPSRTPRRLVVVISLDGFPAYALRDDRLPTPTLRALARQGAVAEGMTTVNPTVGISAFRGKALNLQQGAIP